MDEQEPWVSVDEVGRYIGIATDTIYRRIESKALPAHKIGRFWKLKLTEVDEWARSGGAAAQCTPDVDTEHTDAAVDRAFRKKYTP